MSKQLTKELIQRALDSLYDTAIKGLPGMGSVQDLASEYQKPNRSLEENVRSLVRWQIAKCATSGFLSGLGGLITLPVAVPANISSVLYVQIRMIAAISCMAGMDVKSDKVRTMVYVCLVGNAAGELVNRISIELGTKLATSMFENISGRILIEINQAVGFRLLTKFGETGVINLGNAIPFVGGIIGGSVDGLSCNAVGGAAMKFFIEAS